MIFRNIIYCIPISTIAIFNTTTKKEEKYISWKFSWIYLVLLIPFYPILALYMFSFKLTYCLHVFRVFFLCSPSLYVFELHWKQNIFTTEIFMPHPIRPNNTTAWMLKHGIIETEITMRVFIVLLRILHSKKMTKWGDGSKVTNFETTYVVYGRPLGVPWINMTKLDF